jgi:predicted RNA-binding protein YlxR (DUF448 family)
MTVKKVPLRRCAGCSEQKSKKEFVRVVRTPEGDIILDDTGKANGRGAYLCKNGECVELAQKKRRLEGALKTKVPPELFAELERIISDKGDA